MVNKSSFGQYFPNGAPENSINRVAFVAVVEPSMLPEPTKNFGSFFLHVYRRALMVLWKVETIPWATALSGLNFML